MVFQISVENLCAITELVEKHKDEIKALSLAGFSVESTRLNAENISWVLPTELTTHYHLKQVVSMVHCLSKELVSFGFHSVEAYDDDEEEKEAMGLAEAEDALSNFLNEPLLSMR